MRFKSAHFTHVAIRLEYEGLSENPLTGQVPCHQSLYCKETIGSPCCVRVVFPNTHTLPKLQAEPFHVRNQSVLCLGNHWEALKRFRILFFDSLPYTVLFKKLDTHEMGGGFSVPKDVPFPLVCYTGKIPRKLTEEDWLHPPPPHGKFQISFRSWARSRSWDVFLCAYISFKNIAMSKRGKCCNGGGFSPLPYHLHMLSIYTGSEGEALTSPRLPYAVREVQLI